MSHDEQRALLRTRWRRLAADDVQGDVFPTRVVYYSGFRLPRGEAQTALGEELRTKLAAAVAIFLKISGKPSLLAEQPKTKKAFDARAKYLNALHALQGEAMGRMRAAGAPDEATDEYRQLNDAMIVTVQGIAAGMNNTG